MMGRSNTQPFALSLSKGCLVLCVASELQGFDKLSPNGFALCGVKA
jgi:hypothetical protein